MSIRMMSGLPARVLAVLQDFLPAELDLIDAEEADGITTPDITHWYEWDRPVLPAYPACSIAIVSSIPTTVYTDGFGRTVDATHRMDLKFHVIFSQATTSDPMTLQRLLTRYIAGAMRVLCVMKEALQTNADPTRTVMLVTWAEAATYGPDVEQQEGALVRTAVLPIAIRQYEVR